eukprot:273844-Amphidinium_carterae.1
MPKAGSSPAMPSVRRRMTDDGYTPPSLSEVGETKGNGLRNTLDCADSPVQAGCKRLGALKLDTVVGIWSTIGVSDVRKAFWSAWQSGKDTAA